MEEKNNKNNSKINRRDFFKLAGAGTFASAAALYGCSGKNNRSDSESAALGEIPTDKMVYRTNPTTGDRVSLLGYGCMRFTRKGGGIDLDKAEREVMAAVGAGATQIECTINGLGERAGNAALEEIVMAVKTRHDVFGVHTGIDAAHWRAEVGHIQLALLCAAECDAGQVHHDGAPLAANVGRNCAGGQHQLEAALSVAATLEVQADRAEVHSARRIGHCRSGGRNGLGGGGLAGCLGIAIQADGDRVARGRCAIGRIAPQVEHASAKTPQSEQGDVKEEGIDLLVMPDD